ncbi:MAG: hypothetical protein ABEJ65_02390 [bacterium]
MNIQQAKQDIRNALSPLQPPQRNSLRLRALKQGHMYEAYIFAEVSEQIRDNHAQFSLTLINPTQGQLTLKSSPGTIDRSSYSHVEIHENGVLKANIFTDIEFLSLGYTQRSSNRRSRQRSDCHELDVIVVEEHVRDGKRPDHESIWLGVECKSGAFQKKFMREIFGIRRAISFWRRGTFSTKLTDWPFTDGRCVQKPPVPLILYSQNDLTNYEDSAMDFDVLLKQCRMP